MVLLVSETHIASRIRTLALSRIRAQVVADIRGMPKKREPSIEERVGNRIRNLRESMDLTQHALAKQAGCSRSLVAEAETGQRSVSVGKLQQLAAALGVPLRDLVTDEEWQTNPPDPAEGVAQILRDRGPVYVKAVKNLLRALDEAAAQARGD